MTIQSDVSHRGTQFLTHPDTRKHVLGWLGLGSYLESPVVPANLPQPEFFIGSKVADHWADELDKDCAECGVEYSVVCGIFWHPKQQEWGYLIEWQKGDGEDWMYPCFDERLVIGGDLRSADYD